MDFHTAGYYPTEKYILFGDACTDAAEDHNVIIHEYTHALHDYLMAGGLVSVSEYDYDERWISEGSGDYLANSYRRTVSSYEPNEIAPWYDLPECLDRLEDKRSFGSCYVYPDSILEFNPHKPDGLVWGSSMKDIEELITSQGENGRDVTTKLLLKSFLYLNNGSAIAPDQVAAFFQADYDVYNGTHLKTLGYAFYNRGFFNARPYLYYSRCVHPSNLVSGNILSNTTWSGIKWMDGNVLVAENATLTIDTNATVFIQEGKNITVNSRSSMIIEDGAKIVLYDGSGIYCDGGSSLIVNDAGVESGSSLIILSSGSTCTINSNSTFKINGQGELQCSGTIVVNENGSLQIGDGYKLTAYSGSSFTFGTNARINSLGIVDLQGNQADPVIFTSSLSPPQPGNWYGIVLAGGPNTLQYCNIEYATYGVIVNSTTGTTTENCNISHCSSYGVYGMNAMAIGALRLKGTTLENNTVGLGLGNAWASLEPLGNNNTIVQNNNQHGCYFYNSLAYMNHALIQNNDSGNGIRASGSGSEVYLSANGEQPGWNTIQGNTEQIVSDEGGHVYIGKRTQVCNCWEQSSALQSINKPACPPECYWDWEDSWGYNNIYGTDHWVDNWTSNPIYAHLTYWGNPPSCSAPSSSHFYGTVYTNYPQCYSSAMLSASGGPISDSVRLYHFVKYLKRLIVEEPDSADYVLPLLHPLVGAGGKFTDALEEPWEIFLKRIVQSTPSSIIKNNAIEYRILNRMFAKDYDGVISLANNIIANMPDDNLWLYCQSQKISSYLQMGNIASAEQIYTSMKSKGTRIAPQGMVEIRRMLDITKATTQSIYQPVDEKEISSTTAASEGYELSANYSNPFNPVTTIKYSLPENTKVLLKIYNILGQEVRILVDEFQSAGIKSVSFNAGDLPSGVYFYRLQAGKFIDIKKMLIVR